jgi:uncharacterized protein
MLDLITLLTLCAFAALAGFVDSIVGGGGLIQTPALLFTLPAQPVPVLLGTAKFPSLIGTGMGAWQYSRRVAVRWRLIGPAMGVAFGASLAGAWTLTRLPNTLLKPIIFGLLVLVFLYTLLKKDFGQTSRANPAAFGSIGPFGHVGLWGLSAVVGFYDGFLGPGTGSFFVLGLVALVGLDFLSASTHAKLLNLATNLAGIVLFWSKGYVLPGLLLPMAAANLTGAFLGARLALRRGNGFIRVFFLLVTGATLLRLGWELFG